MAIQTQINWYYMLLILLLVSCRATPKLDTKYEPLPYTNQEKDELDEPDAINFTSEKDPSWENPLDGYEITSGTEDDTWDYFTAEPPRFKEMPIKEVEDRRWGPIYFAYDQSYIGESERKKLEKLADYLIRNPEFIVVVEGHCDERGSEEYNRSLGEKRALSVRDYLASLGVDRTKMNTVSYGEARPAYIGDNEKEHARNRRAEFIIGLPKN